MGYASLLEVRRGVDAVETAIRNALEKGNALDSGFREKVYRSAFSVLDRSLKARPDLPPATAERRRRHLEQKIREIETEFAPAVEPEAEPLLSEADLALGEDDLAPAAGPEQAPPVSAADEPHGRHEERRRRLGAWLLVFAGLVIVAAGAWWLIVGQGVRQGAPVAAGSGERPAGEPAAATDEEGWITVFTPSDPTRVQAAGGARAEVVEDEDGPLLRIVSADGERAVGFSVGQGVLERLAGRPAVFNIVARAQEGGQTEMSVSCDFGGLGDCGRARFVVGPTRSDYLFRVDLGQGRPEGGGTIAIVPDVSGKGRALEIFGIHASAAE